MTAWPPKDTSLWATCQKALNIGQVNRPTDKMHLEELLDAALAGTFPASDPVSGLVSERTPTPLPEALPESGAARDESEQQSGQ